MANSKIKKAEEALIRYYVLQNASYLDANGIGKLQLWANENGYDSELIEEELNNDATQSALIEVDKDFPPNNIQHEDILYILRKCWLDPNAFLPQKIEISTEKKEKFAKGDGKTNQDNNAPETPPTFISKYTSQLIVAGYQSYDSNVNSSTEHCIPDSMLELICNFYYLRYSVYKFSDFPSMRCGYELQQKDTCHYKLNENNSKYTKVSETPSWAVSHIMGIKAGVHVFRYFFYYPAYLDDDNNCFNVFFGLQRFKPGSRGVGYGTDVHSGYLIGWESWGKHYVRNDYAKNDQSHQTNKSEDLKYCIPYSSRIAILDLKLDCDEYLLSTKIVSVDRENVSCEETVIQVDTELTERYGWVPHVSIYHGAQSLMICEINTDFYGQSVAEIDNPIYQNIIKDVNLFD